MRDLHDVGGVPLLMKALMDGGYIHGDCMTVTGKTIAENLEGVAFNVDQPIIRPTSNPDHGGRRRRRVARQSGP